MVGDERLDELILSLAMPDWQKVALIIAKVCKQLEGVSSNRQGEEVAKRIEHLVGQNRLEFRGDLARWRTSEVRLPPVP